MNRRKLLKAIGLITGVMAAPVLAASKPVLFDGPGFISGDQLFISDSSWMQIGDVFTIAGECNSSNELIRFTVKKINSGTSITPCCLK